MRYGYFMMPLHPPGALLADTLETDLRQVQELERLGYEEVWVGEHFTHEWENIPAPETFIGAALQRTSRIRLGTGVSCLPNHNPFMLAHRIALLDHLARGRFFWGIGPGNTPGDFEVLGIDLKSGLHREIAHEMVDTILKLWDAPEPGLYQGRTWRFWVPEPDAEINKRVYLKPYTQPHPPIAVAGSSERSESLGLAGERGWIPMSSSIPGPRVLRTHWAHYEQGAGRAAAAVSREIWRIARTVHVADTTEQARREVREGAIGEAWRGYFLPLLRKTRMIERLKGDPSIADDAVDMDYLCDTLFIVGDPQECARKMRELYQQVGGFGMLLALAHDWSDPGVWQRSMALLAQEVMPRLKDLTGAPQRIAV